MTGRLLIPRLSTGQALTRLIEIERDLKGGKEAAQLPRVETGQAVPNATGGRAAVDENLREWRSEVIASLAEQRTGTDAYNGRYERALGKAISVVIDPSPSDAAHDGVWSFLSLMVFPDFVFARWPFDAKSGELSRDRWIGAQAGRDRNYLKVTWRRWQVFGSLVEPADAPLGEDELVNLLERTALARNLPLVRAAAQQIVGFTGHGSRMEFSRELLKQLTYLTGPRQLDFLTEEETKQLVAKVALDVMAARQPAKRAAY